MKQITEMLKKIDKKYLVGVAALLVILCVGSAFTWSYYQAELETKVNTFVAGNVETHIEEEFKGNSPTNFTKTPRIVNTGKNDCYVRVRLTMSPFNAIITTNFEATGAKEDWVYNEADGFYYYTKPLIKGNTTGSTSSKLFTEINITNPEEVDGFNVDVYQEAVQAEVYKADGSKVTAYQDIWKIYEEQIK